MERVCQPLNIERALTQVVKNRGSAGVDGMKVEELEATLEKEWPRLQSQLLGGTYQPQPIRRVEIPKPGSSKTRKLGIPTVLDRLIQQALLQVLQPVWDPSFSDLSFGFRPGRSAHQAVAQAQDYIQTGYSYVVDIDLESFFDQINHDKLMSQLAKRIPDKRVLKLIRAFLTAGTLEGGLIKTPTEGSSQGGPLSPFLSNIVLDELDRELEARGHKFVRYADDCNIYVKSRKAGERVMQSITHFLEKRLKLKVNSTKSAVGRPQERKFLGFAFTDGKLPNRRKVSEPALQRFRAKVRHLTRRRDSVSIENRILKLKQFLIGWKAYYGFAEAKAHFRDLDSWIRRRLRAIVWKQWRTFRTRLANLIALGVRQESALGAAWSSKGHWRLAHTPAVRMALNNAYFDKLGLPRLHSSPNIQQK